MIVAYRDRDQTVSEATLFRIDRTLRTLKGEVLHDLVALLYVFEFRF